MRATEGMGRAPLGPGPCAPGGAVRKPHGGRGAWAGELATGGKHRSPRRYGPKISPFEPLVHRSGTSQMKLRPSKKMETFTATGGPGDLSAVNLSRSAPGLLGDGTQDAMDAIADCRILSFRAFRWDYHGGRQMQITILTVRLKYYGL